MTKIPSMPWFPADFFADTADISRAAAHAYLFLLGHAWLRSGKLLNDDPSLARMAGFRLDQWNKIKSEVLGFWQIGDDGFIRNNRLTKEWSYIEDKRARLKGNGALGGRPKSPMPQRNKSQTMYGNRTWQNSNGDHGERSNSLNYNDMRKADGLFPETKVKAPNPNPIKKEFLNGISGQKRENRHWVTKGTPQWNAWVDTYQKLHGRDPVLIRHYETGESGMFFRTEWPPP